jgi:hypothetical protein
MKLSEAPPVRWAGSHGRYGDFPGAVVRAFDPYSLKPITFAGWLDLDAWGQVRFRDDIKSVTTKPTKVQASIDGVSVEAKATFTAITRAGGREYHHVSQDGSVGQIVRDLQRVAEKNGATVHVHTREALLADASFNSRIRRLIQASVIHLRDGAAVDPLILAVVRDGATTRSELHRRISPLAGQLADGRAAQLHCAGLLRLALTSDDYAIQLGRGRHA